MLCNHLLLVFFSSSEHRGCVPSGRRCGLKPQQRCSCSKPFPRPVALGTLRSSCPRQLAGGRGRSGRDSESGTERTEWRRPTFSPKQDGACSQLKTRERISLTFTCAKFSGRVPIVPRGSAIENGPPGGGARKRWLRTIRRLVCGFKCYWTGCRAMSLAGIAWFRKRTASWRPPPVLGPRSPLWVTQTLTFGMPLHCLVAPPNSVLSLWLHAGHAASETSSQRPFPCSEFL